MIPGPEEDCPILEGVRVLLAQAECRRFLKPEFGTRIAAQGELITSNGILHDFQCGARVGRVLPAGRGLGNDHKD